MIAHATGLGTTSQLAFSTLATAGGTFSTLAATALATSAVGGPVGIAVGAIVAGVATILNMTGVGTGCGDPCIKATQIVNQAEPVLRQNLAAYQAGQIDQATAISNFEQVWVAIQQACGVIPGTAGSACVGDRQEGACKWKDANGCWNWFIGYRDPLLVPQAGVSGSNTPGVASLLSGGNSSMWLVGGIAALGLWMTTS